MCCHNLDGRMSSVVPVLFAAMQYVFRNISVLFCFGLQFIDCMAMGMFFHFPPLSLSDTQCWCLRRSELQFVPWFQSLSKLPNYILVSCPLTSDSQFDSFTIWLPNVSVHRSMWFQIWSVLFCCSQFLRWFELSLHVWMNTWFPAATLWEQSSFHSHLFMDNFSQGSFTHFWCDSSVMRLISSLLGPCGRYNK
jgi:hypothetical protein